MPEMVKNAFRDAPGESLSYLHMFAQGVELLRMYYRLLLACLALCLLLGLGIIVAVPPQYTAEAVIGPAPSTLDQLESMSSGLAGALTRGLGQRIGLGGGMGTDNFNEYVELLTSDRLAAKMARDPNVLRAVFYQRYDWDTHRWKVSRGIVSDLKNDLKALFHRPIKSAPGVDDMAKFLATSVSVDSPLTSNFATVSLRAGSPIKAQWLLHVMLSDADAIIRQDRREDVASRIAYISKVLPTISENSEKQALAAVLANQQEAMMMVQADKQYAADMIDKPHARSIPTSPSVLSIFGLMLLVGFAMWGGAVTLLPSRSFILIMFSRPPGPAGTAAGHLKSRGV